MIICKSKYGVCDRCVIDMDGQQSFGGTIVCDTAIYTHKIGKTNAVFQKKLKI